MPRWSGWRQVRGCRSCCAMRGRCAGAAAVVPCAAGAAPGASLPRVAAGVRLAVHGWNVALPPPSLTSKVCLQGMCRMLSLPCRRRVRVLLCGSADLVRNPRTCSRRFVLLFSCRRPCKLASTAQQPTCSCKVHCRHAPPPGPPSIRRLVKTGMLPDRFAPRLNKVGSWGSAGGCCK